MQRPSITNSHLSQDGNIHYCVHFFVPSALKPSPTLVNIVRDEYWLLMQEVMNSLSLEENLLCMRWCEAQLRADIFNIVRMEGCLMLSIMQWRADLPIHEFAFYAGHPWQWERWMRELRWA